MSYGRDPDRASRGPGAIAAIDRVGGRRHDRRIADARATARRDRAMAAVAGGALGRIDLPLGTRTRPSISSPALAPKPRLSPLIMPVLGKATSVIKASMQPRPPVAAPPPSIPPPPSVVMVPPAVMVLPPPPATVSPPTLVPPPIAVVTRTTGGGGGGGGGGGIVPKPPTIRVAPPSILEPGQLDVAPGHTIGALLPVLGGAAVALFLMFRKGGS